MALKNKTVRAMAKRHNAMKSPKYARMDAALQEPQVTIKPVAKSYTGPGGKTRSINKGMQALAQYLPRRPITIQKSLDEVEAAYTKKKHTIKWNSIEWMYKLTSTRYGKDLQLGADVLVRGKASNGDTVVYFYDNTNYAESAYRAVIINGKKMVFSTFNYKFKIQ